MGPFDKVKDSLVHVSDRLDDIDRKRQEKKEDDDSNSENGNGEAEAEGDAEASGSSEQESGAVTDGETDAGDGASAAQGS